MEEKQKKSYLHRILNMLVGGVIAIVALQILTNFSTFAGTMKTLLGVFSSLAYGVVFAFLLNPVVAAVDKRLRPALLKTKLKPKLSKTLSRVIGLLFSFVAFGLMLYTLVAMIAPQLYDSVVGIVDNMPSYYVNAETWILKVLEDNPSLRNIVDTIMERGYSYVQDYIQNELVVQVQNIMVTLTSSVFSILVTVTNMVIGVVVSIYILMSKDTFIAQSKKLTVASFDASTADYLMDIARRIHKIFNGFIVGKLIDSLIIGVLAYIGVVCMKMPFPMLLATIIGVTNIIPYFGPFIGAIPCALLILLVSPIQCFYFVIFIIILQQVDGNIIGPRILGDNLGISGFWILISITVGSGLFGFMGMLLGVPVFAVVYMLVGDFAIRKLRGKGKPTATEEYYPIQNVDELDKKEEKIEEIQENEAKNEKNSG